MWAVRNYYDQIGFSSFTASAPIYSDKDFEKVLKEIFDEKKNEGNIPKDLFTKTFSELSSGVSEGYGSINYDLKDAGMIMQLKNNVAVFSAFKSNHQASAMRGLLVNDQGEKRSWNEFLKEAQKLNPTYNQLWLEAEYNMAIRQARSAEQWQDFERNKDLYPNLEYMPSRSANPSDTHRQYYGLIFPIDDPIWNTLMPPSRWGCKCWVQQTTENPSDKKVEAPLPVDGIAGNSGKTGNVFSATHPFIKELSKSEKTVVKSQLNKLREANNELIEMKVGKNAIMIHVNADQADLSSNLSFAEAFVKKYKADMIINGHTNVPGMKNPEFSYKKMLGDQYRVKSDDLRKSVSNSFKKLENGGQLREEKKCFLGLDFNGKLKSGSVQDVAGQLYGKMKRYTNLKMVLLKNGDKVTIIKNDNKLSTTLLSEIIEGELLK